jgi:hypothetical protein
VVDQLRDLLGRAVGVLVLGRHPRLGRLLDDLLADRVHALREQGHRAGARGRRGRLRGQLVPQLLEALHRYELWQARV